MTPPKYTYFWRVESPFSQHHPANFEVDGITFNCAEQYYMYKKAMLFGDKNSAKNILKSNNPAQQKSFGRKIKFFDDEHWDTVAKKVVYNGNFNKFQQNRGLMNLLLAAKGTTLVEASPMDKKWGVGLDASDSRIIKRNEWLGTNLLGFTLSRLLNDFIQMGYIYDESVYNYKNNESKITFWRTSSPFHPKHITPFSINGTNFCSLHHYLSYICADTVRKSKILFTLDQKKLAYNSNKLDIWRHILDGNYYKFYENENIRAQLLNTAGNEIIFIDNDSQLGSGTKPIESNLNDISGKNDGKNLIGRCLTFLRDQWLKNGIKYQLNKIVRDFEREDSITDTFSQSDSKNSKKKSYKKQSYNHTDDFKAKKRELNSNEIATSHPTKLVWEESKTVDSSTLSDDKISSKHKSKKKKRNRVESGLNDTTRSKHKSKKRKKKKVPTATLR